MRIYTDDGTEKHFALFAKNANGENDLLLLMISILITHAACLTRWLNMSLTSLGRKGLCIMWKRCNDRSRI